MRSVRAALAFYWIYAYKIGSAFVQIYILSLVATNGSSQEPFLNLKTIAHLGALAAGLRAVDALLDPAFQKLNPFRTEEERKVAVAAVATVSSPAKENP